MEVLHILVRHRGNPNQKYRNEWLDDQRIKSTNGRDSFNARVAEEYQVNFKAAVLDEVDGADAVYEKACLFGADFTRSNLAGVSQTQVSKARTDKTTRLPVD